MERGELVGPLRLLPRVFQRVEDVLVILPRLHAGRRDHDLRMCKGDSSDRDNRTDQKYLAHIPLGCHLFGRGGTHS